MAKPYREGTGWCVRVQYKGRQEYFSGYRTQAAAARAARDWRNSIDALGVPDRDGPERTYLAQALQDYALEQLPFLKGAPQEARRINVYLELAGLPRVVVTGLSEQEPQSPHDKRATVYYEVSLESPEAEKRIPNSLKGHRAALMTKTSRTQQVRRYLATRWVSDITRQDLQALICALRRDRIAPATIGLERAMLRVLFNHAKGIWRWALDNPASGLKMPKVDNDRKRVLSAREQVALERELARCRNPFVAPYALLLVHTAMRASEPTNARWRDVDWQRRVLTLTDSKTGSREVPLAPGAIEALHALRAAHKDGEPALDDVIVPITYEAFKAAWIRVCEKAGLEGLRIHDLRHTAATRLALESGGNVFLVKALTGHSSWRMLGRYVNVTADDVVNHWSNSSAHKAQQPTPETREVRAPAVDTQASIPDVDAAYRPEAGALPVQSAASAASGLVSIEQVAAIVQAAVSSLLPQLPTLVAATGAAAPAVTNAAAVVSRLLQESPHVAANEPELLASSNAKGWVAAREPGANMSRRESMASS